MVGDLSLGESMRGKAINSFLGSYNAGTCVFRVRSTLKGNAIKAMGIVPIVTEEDTQYFDFPFVVEEGDVVEAMTQAVA